MLFVFCFVAIVLTVADAYYTGERYKKHQFIGELNPLVRKGFWKYGVGGIYAAIGIPTLVIAGLCGYFGLTPLIAFYAGARSMLALNQYLAYRKGL